MSERKLKNFDELKAEMEAKQTLTAADITMYMHLFHQAGVRLGSEVVSKSFSSLINVLGRTAGAAKDKHITDEAC